MKPAEKESRRARLAALAAANECVVAVKELFAIGYSEDELETLVHRKLWQRPQRGVYLLSAGEMTWRQRALAAVLAAGPEAQLSARALAAWLHVDGASEGVIDIVVPYGKGPMPRGVKTHRSRRMGKPRIYDDIVRGTSIERMLVDYASFVDVELAERAVENVLTRGLTAERRIWREIAELGDAVPGVIALARIMVDRPEGKAARSTLELELFRIVKRHGLPMPIRNFDVWVGDEHFEIDAVYLDVMGAIEADSKRWHRTSSQRARDKRRQAGLEAAGWTFRRFTSADIYGRPEWVAAEIRALVCGVAAA